MLYVAVVTQAETVIVKRIDVGTDAQQLRAVVQVVQYYPNMVYVDRELVDITSCVKTDT